MSKIVIPTTVKGYRAAPFLGLAAFVMFCALLPIALVRFPPINDYPFHLARIIIMNRMDDPVFDRFYDWGSFLLPNVAMDVAALAIAKLAGPELAMRIFAGLTILTPLIGVLVLHRAAWGRLSVWPLLVLVFLYNGVFVFGFFNYLFGLGLAFLTVALWMVTGPGAVRQVTGFLSALVLMFCHMSAFGVFGVIVGGMEMHRAAICWREAGWRTALAGLCMTALPFVMAVILFAAFSPTASVTAQGFGYADFYGAKPLGFLFSQSSTIPWLDLVMGGALAGLCGWLALSGRVKISKPLAVSAALLSLAFLVMPASLMGSHFADVRLGPAISMLLLAATDFSGNGSPVPGRMVSIAVCGLAAILAWGLVSVWTRDERQLAPIVRALEGIEPGATLFAATAEPYPRLLADTGELRAAWRPPLKHVASYAVLHHPVFVPMTFADPTKQPMIVEPDYGRIKEFQGDNPVKTPDRKAFGELLARITDHLAAGAWPDIGAPYLLVVGSGRLQPLVLPPGVSRISEGERYVLLRIAPAGPQ